MEAVEEGIHAVEKEEDAGADTCFRGQLFPAQPDEEPAEPEQQDGAKPKDAAERRIGEHLGDINDAPEIRGIPRDAEHAEKQVSLTEKRILKVRARTKGAPVAGVS